METAVVLSMETIQRPLVQGHPRGCGCLDPPKAMGTEMLQWTWAQRHLKGPVCGDTSKPVGAATPKMLWQMWGHHKGPEDKGSTKVLGAQTPQLPCVQRWPPWPPQHVGTRFPEPLLLQGLLEPPNPHVPHLTVG